MLTPSTKKMKNEKKTQKTVFPRGMLRRPHRLPGLLPHRFLLLPEDVVQGEALERERKLFWCFFLVLGNEIEKEGGCVFLSRSFSLSTDIFFRPPASSPRARGASRSPHPVFTPFPPFPYACCASLFVVFPLFSLIVRFSVATYKRKKERKEQEHPGPSSQSRGGRRGRLQSSLTASPGAAPGARPLPRASLPAPPG